MTTSNHPVVVGLPLTEEAEDVLDAARELATRLGAPLHAVHSIGTRRLESARGLAERRAEAERRLAKHLEPLRDSGVAVEVEITTEPADEAVTRAAQRAAAQMIVVGGGRPSTLRRWFVGSVAEEVVRSATVPVWVARGTTPNGHGVLCPVDLTPPSRAGLEAAIAMARLFESPLTVLMVLATPPRPGEPSPTEARERLEGWLAELGGESLKVKIALESGDAAETILEASENAGLLVLGGRGFDPLMPGRLGPMTTKALRSSRTSILAVREVDETLVRIEHSIADAAELLGRARALVADGRAEEALPLLAEVAERAPMNAAVQETYAAALRALGRDELAHVRERLARMIREDIG